MAIYTFDGTENIAIDDFDFDEDVVIFDGISADEISSVEDTPAGTRISSTTGFSITFTGLTLAQLGAGEAQFFPEVVVLGTNSGDIVGDPDSDLGRVALGLEEGDIVYGGEGDDKLFGNQGGDLLYGNGGSDWIHGGQDGDAIYALGDDAPDDLVVYGGLGGDSINVGGASGLSGDATIYGGNASADTLDGKDSINVAMDGGTAVIYGNSGSDVIQLFAPDGGDITVYGGMGSDTLNTKGVLDSAIVVGGKDGDNLRIFADDLTVYGGNSGTDAADGGDRIEVYADNALIYGNAGIDDIYFSAGAAVVHGGADDDIVNGSVDNGTIYGGMGEDRIGNLGGLNVLESAVIYGGNGSADADDVSDGIFVSLDDNDASAIVYGNGGDDLIDVRTTSALDDGGVTIYGGQGKDIIQVLGDVNAVVVSGVGDDTILINVGNSSTITGGAGKDIFSFDEKSFTGTSPQDETDVNFITDLNFAVDDLTFEGFGDAEGQPDVVSDLTTLAGDDAEALSAAIAGAGSLGAAANAALDFFVAQSDDADDGDDIALVFEYEGEDYLVTGSQEVVQDPEGFPIGSDGSVETIVRITGYTGTISEGSFTTLIEEV